MIKKHLILSLMIIAGSMECAWGDLAQENDSHMCDIRVAFGDVSPASFCKIVAISDHEGSSGTTMTSIEIGASGLFQWNEADLLNSRFYYADLAEANRLRRMIKDDIELEAVVSTHYPLLDLLEQNDQRILTIPDGIPRMRLRIDKTIPWTRPTVHIHFAYVDESSGYQKDYHIAPRERRELMFSGEVSSECRDIIVPIPCVSDYNKFDVPPRRIIKDVPRAYIMLRPNLEVSSMYANLEVLVPWSARAIFPWRSELVIPIVSNPYTYDTEEPLYWPREGVAWLGLIVERKQ